MVNDTLDDAVGKATRYKIAPEPRRAGGAAARPPTSNLQEVLQSYCTRLQHDICKK